MDRVTIEGNDFAVPQNMCVSCGQSATPGAAITATYAVKGYQRKFPFPACGHCADLYRRFARITTWLAVVAIVVIVGGFMGVALSGALAKLAPGFGGTVPALLGVGLVIGLAILFYLSAKGAEAIALRSLGNADPPLRMIRVTSVVPGRKWTFHFENEAYASRFRSLNAGIVRGG